MSRKLYGYAAIACIITIAFFLAYTGFQNGPGTGNNLTGPGDGTGGLTGTDIGGTDTAVTVKPSDMPPATPTRSKDTSETIEIAAFNIQIFGEKKASNADVMNVLAGTVRNYDIIGIQEIRDRNGTALPALVTLVNEGTDENGQNFEYRYVVSPRLGRSSSKEQYAFVYNAKKVSITSDPWVFPDDEEYFEREPYVASFSAVNGDFEAVLMLIHTKPDEAAKEIGRLTEVMDYAKTEYADKDNFLVMGDFNADGAYFNEDGDSPLKSADYIWLIGNDVVTTTKTENTYDRIVITAEMAPYYTGNAGVYDIKTIYSLNQSQLTEVSDHYPIYAEFRAWADAGAAGIVYILAGRLWF